VIAGGGDPGPLAGVPVGVKDLTETAGLVTTYGSTAYRSNVPGEDAVLVARLRAAGAIVVGKTNTPAFGMLGETKNRLGPDCRNPLAPTRTPGGSSGGSAAAVAAGLVPLATGTDSAGSIAAPASFCGVVGLKASLGRIPTAPAPDDSLQWLCNGPLAMTVADCVAAFRVLAGHDPRDPVARLDRFAEPEAAIGGLRVAFSRDLGFFAVDATVAGHCEAAARRLEGLGAAVTEDAPRTEHPFEVYSPLFMADVRRSVLPVLDDGELFPESVAEIAATPAQTAEEYVGALRRLWRFRSVQASFFERYDAILCPATATVAFPLGDPPAVIGGRTVEAGWMTFMPFPTAFNLGGQPTVTIPVGVNDDGLPVGLMIAAAPGREDTCIRIARALEVGG
jgi:Asp-tRNA(Asn)/Glu-tRNA(Gln) amidotransferase A subunit family amidase